MNTGVDVEVDGANKLIIRSKQRQIGSVKWNTYTPTLDQANLAGPADAGTVNLVQLKVNQYP